MNPVRAPRIAPPGTPSLIDITDLAAPPLSQFGIGSNRSCHHNAARRSLAAKDWSAAGGSQTASFALGL
jgi:hypothetical protein